MRCQSCGMRVSDYENIPGTERDSSPSRTYCINCYRGGQFVEPEITMDEMAEKVVGIMANMKIPSFVRERVASEIHTLGRWSK